MLSKTEYEGKAKRLYPLSHAKVKQEIAGQFPDDSWVQMFKDDLTAFNAQKHSQKAGKGMKNQIISSICFRYLNACGFRTHFLGTLDETRQVIQQLDMIPVECVVRRIATGSLVKRYGIVSGTRLNPPLVEFFLKNDDLNDPLMAPVHVPLIHKDVSFAMLQRLELISTSVYGFLEALFKACDLVLVDGKFEFGLRGNEIVLGDEISPDTMRLWTRDGQKLDKDVFRHDLGDVMNAYDEVLRRLKEVNLDSLAKYNCDCGVACEPYDIVCSVTPQADVLDPEGQATLDVIRQSSLKGIQDIKAGRVFKLRMERVLSGNDLELLEELGGQLLANPLIQRWDWRINPTVDG